jgi:hypothetical protein
MTSVLLSCEARPAFLYAVTIQCISHYSIHEEFKNLTCKEDMNQSNNNMMILMLYLQVLPYLNGEEEIFFDQILCDYCGSNMQYFTIKVR